MGKTHYLKSTGINIIITIIEIMFYLLFLLIVYKKQDNLT